MNLLHLQYLLYVVRDGMFVLMLLMFFENIRMHGFKLKDFLTCPYFYLLVLTNRLNKDIVNNAILSIVISFMAYVVFTELIRRYINDNKK